MSRRRRLGDSSGALGAKRRRPELPGEAPRPDGSPSAVEAALAALTSLFPRRLFGDSLPPLVLRHQLYDIVRDRTAVDRHLNRLRDEGRVRLLHLGLGPDALGVVSLELYRQKALEAAAGTPREGLVRRFLERAVAASAELSFEQRGMREMGFGDGDVTQLVAAGLLTVRDAGSWWLAVPGAGRFVRALLRGRRAVLALVRRSRQRQIPLRELQGDRAPPGLRRGLGASFVLHDLLGAQRLCRGRDGGGGASAAAAGGGRGRGLGGDPRDGAAARGAGAGAVGERGVPRGGPHLPRAPAGRRPRGGSAGLRRGPQALGRRRGRQDHRLPPLLRRRCHLGPHGGGGGRRLGGGWAEPGGAAGGGGRGGAAALRPLRPPPPGLRPPRHAAAALPRRGALLGSPPEPLGRAGRGGVRPRAGLRHPEAAGAVPGPPGVLRARHAGARRGLAAAQRRRGAALAPGGGPARHPLRGPPAAPRLHPRRVPALRAPRRLHRRQHPEPGPVPVPVPDAGAQLGRGGVAAARRRQPGAGAAGPGRGRGGSGQPGAGAVQQPGTREPAREPDAALELRQRQHVVGAWPARVGGAQRVLGAGGTAPRGAARPRPPGLPHLREGAERPHRERLIGHHQPGGRPLTPAAARAIKPLAGTRLASSPAGGVAGPAAGTVAIATR